MNTPIPIYVFSGTGNTLITAETLKNEGSKYSMSFELIDLTKKIINDIQNNESMPAFFGIMYPVMGGGSPRIIHHWAKSLPGGNGQRCFFLLTAAGAEHPINKGAASSIIRILKKKNYVVDYVRILGMGSNWFMNYPGDLIRQLASLLPEKCNSVIKALRNGEKRTPGGNPAINGLLRLMAFMEDQVGARVWGRLLKADESCTGCGLCARQCAIENISINKEKKAVFGWSCQWCMKCVYNCPAEAIRPRFFKSAVLSEPYRLKRILKTPDTGEDSKQIKKLKRLFGDYLENPEI